MAKKNGFVLTGSVQEKNGKLYLVYPHYDPIKQVAKPKWKSMGLYEGEKKAVIEKKKRELLRELTKPSLIDAAEKEVVPGRELLQAVAAGNYGRILHCGRLAAMRAVPRLSPAESRTA